MVFQQRVKNLPLFVRKGGIFLTIVMIRMHVGLALSDVNLLLGTFSKTPWYFLDFDFLMENIYVQFDGMVYQQIVGNAIGTNCAPLIADLFLYCYESDFMSNFQKFKRFDHIDKFSDTSRYLDDIFTIDNTAFAEHIPDIYLRELQLN